MKIKFNKVTGYIYVILTIVLILYCFSLQSKLKQKEINRIEDINKIENSFYQRDSISIAINIQQEWLSNTITNHLKYDEKVICLYIPNGFCWGCSKDRLIDLCSLMHNKTKLILICSESQKRDLLLLKMNSGFNYDIIEVNNENYMPKKLTYLFFNPYNESLIAYVETGYYDISKLLVMDP